MLVEVAQVLEDPGNSTLTIHIELWYVLLPELENQNKHDGLVEIVEKKSRESSLTSL